MSSLIERAITKADFPAPLPAFPYYGWFAMDPEVDFWNNPLYMFRDKGATLEDECVFARVHPKDLDNPPAIPPKWLEYKKSSFFNYIRSSFSRGNQPANEPWNFLNPFYIYIEGGMIDKAGKKPAVTEWIPLPTLFAGLYPMEFRHGESVEGPGFWTEDPLKAVSIENWDINVYAKDFIMEKLGDPGLDNTIVIRLKAVQLMRVLTFGSVDMVANRETWHIEDMHGRIIQLEANPDPSTSRVFPFIGTRTMRGGFKDGIIDDARQFPKIYDRFGRCQSKLVYDDLYCVFGEDRIAPKTNFLSSVNEFNLKRD